MRSDEPPGVDDHRPDVGRLSVGHPYDVPVTLRLQQRVEQVDVHLGKHLGRRGLGTLPREDGKVGDMDGGDGVEGEALAQVVGAVQPAVLGSQFSAFGTRFQLPIFDGTSPARSRRAWRRPPPPPGARWSAAASAAGRRRRPRSRLPRPRTWAADPRRGPSAAARSRPPPCGSRGGRRAPCARTARGSGRDRWPRPSATRRRTSQASANRNGGDRPACAKHARNGSPIQVWAVERPRARQSLRTMHTISLSGFRSRGEWVQKMPPTS